MDPLDAIEAMTEAWAKGGQAFAEQAMTGQAFAAGPKTPLGAWADAIAKVTRDEAEGADDAAARPIGPEFQALERARQAFAQAMSAAVDRSGALSESLRSAAGEADPATAGILDEILAKVLGPSGWFGGQGPGIGQMDERLSRMAEGPRLADLQAIERKVTAVTTAWLALRRRNLEHDTLILGAWHEAAARFSEQRKAEAGTPGERAASWRALLDEWVETANAALMQHQRSEAGLASQRELVRAATELKLAQQALAECYSEMLGLPTRAEMDEAHRNIAELRREVRALKRSLREPGGAA